MKTPVITNIAPNDAATTEEAIQTMEDERNSMIHELKNSQPDQIKPVLKKTIQMFFNINSENVRTFKATSDAIRNNSLAISNLDKKAMLNHITITSSFNNVNMNINNVNTALTAKINNVKTDIITRNDNQNAMRGEMSTMTNSMTQGFGDMRSLMLQMMGVGVGSPTKP